MKEGICDRLDAIFGDGFHVKEEEIVCADDGESPGWRIWSPFEDGYVVRFDAGWYGQEGEADGEDGLIDLMRAMIAASKALDESLRKAREQK